MSYRPVKRKVRNVSSTTYTFSNIHKVEDEQSERRRLGPEPGSSEAIGRNLTARSRARKNRKKLGANREPRRKLGANREPRRKLGANREPPTSIDESRSNSYMKEGMKPQPDESEEDEDPNLQKRIPVNNATEEKGKLQEPSWGTAIENEDDVAGEDTKIKRPKAEKFNASLENPIDAKIKKQLSNLKSIIKGRVEMDSIDGYISLDGEKVDFGNGVLIHRNDVPYVIEDYNKHLATNPSGFDGSANPVTKISQIGMNASDANYFSNWYLKDRHKWYKPPLSKNDFNHTMDDVDSAGFVSEQQVDEEGEDEPLDVNIENTTLGEALGIERPRIK